MKARRHSSTLSSHSPQKFNHQVPTHASFNSKTPKNAQLRGVASKTLYESNSKENIFAAQDLQQIFDYVPKVSLNLMDLPIPSQDIALYVSTPDKKALKSQYASNSAPKNVFTPLKRDIVTDKNYNKGARTMSAAKSYHKKPNVENSSGKSAYVSILSRESARKNLLNQTHDHRLTNFRLSGRNSPNEESPNTSLDYGATSKSPERRYTLNNTTEQLSGILQFSKPPAYKHRQKNELYEKIIEKILQKENIEPTKESHIHQQQYHHRTNSSLTGSTTHNRSQSGSPKNSYPSVSSRKDTLQNLKSINILASEDTQNDTKTGLALIKKSVDEAFEEKKNLEEYILKLREEIHALKDEVKNTEKNQTVLRNQAIKLSATNERLDRNLLENQNYLSKVKQDILAFQGNVTSNQEKLEALEMQIKEEQSLIDIHKLTIKDFKNYIVEETKEREKFKEAVIQSRRMLKRQIDDFENLEREKQKILITIQSQLKYMMQLPPR